MATKKQIEDFKVRFAQEMRKVKKDDGTCFFSEKDIKYWLSTITEKDVGLNPAQCAQELAM